MASKDSGLWHFFAGIRSLLFKPFPTRRHQKVKIQGEKALGSAFGRKEQRL